MQSKERNAIQEGFESAKGRFAELTDSELEAVNAGTRIQAEFLEQFGEMKNNPRSTGYVNQLTPGQDQPAPGYSSMQTDFMDTILENYRSDFQAALDRAHKATQPLKESVDALLEANARISRNI